MKSVRRIWRMVLFTLVLGVFAESPVSAQFKAKALHSAPARLADFTPHILTSGTPVTFTIGPVKQNTLFSGDFSSMITVPAGATRLEIKLETQPSGADVDLYARFGADVTLNNGSVVADHGSEGSTGSESIVITSTSSPALKAGDYYIALGLFTFDTTATVTLTATVTGGAAVPVVPANGVVNAADGTAAVAPGTILSLYGSNLATGTLKGPLPMVTGLLGSSVEVLSGGQTLVAPLFFVSPGQINAQLPYEAKTGAAQVRVRTAAGVSAWVDLTVQATAPRVLTMNMRGNGAAIMQHAADYRLVGDEAPAQSGEVLILYLIGLGATQPVARTGQAAGDGASLGPLNSSLNVTVTMGGVNAPVLWAGLTPALVGLYQINLRVPAGPPQGDIAIVVGCSGVNSQTSVTSRFSTGGTLVIGTGGGAVTSGGTTVTVPAGTFDQAVTLKVSTIANLPAPTDGRVTDVARVEGLPAIVRQPIRLALNITGTPPAGKALVFVRFDEEEGRGPMVLPAEIVNGQMIATLAAMPAGITTQSAPARAAVVDSNPLNAALWGVAGVGEESSPGGKATVHYHVGDIKDFDLAVEAGKLVDEAFGKLASAGVDTARRKTPVDVYLFSFSGTLGRIFQSDTNAEGETETELWGKAAVGLSLNLDVMRGKGSDAVRTTVGHELFHIVQSLYDPRPLWRRNYIKSPWLWMMEAASTWFEKKMARTSPYLSSNALANADFLFNHGLEFTPGDKTEVSRHGYGASMFLEYMTQYKGDAFPGTLFLEMEPSSGVVFQTPKYSPVEGLYNNEILLSFKWTDFVQKYAKGEVHPSLSMNNLLTSARTETYTFASDSDTGRQFQWDSPDLSAHLYKVEFKKWTSQWPAGTKVTFQMTGPRDAEMTVWKAQTGSGWTMPRRFTGTGARSRSTPIASVRC